MGIRNVLASQTTGRVVAQGVYPRIESEGHGNQREDQGEAPSILLPSLPHLGRAGIKVAKQRPSAQSAVQRQGLMGMITNEVLFPRSKLRIWGCRGLGM